MANFNYAYMKTMGHEGGYANDPDDAGKETYKGISRKYHPNWEGWRIIDSYKSSSNFPNNLRNDHNLDSMVKSFFKKEYWDTVKGDDIRDQFVAEELFDTSVNMGHDRASKFLQQALNLLNNNGKRYSDISEDGVIGPNTLRTLETYLSLKDRSYLLKIMNILQGSHYIDYMRRSPNQEKYAFGWLKRVEIKKIY